MCWPIELVGPASIRDKMGAIPNATIIPRTAPSELTAKSEKRE